MLKIGIDVGGTFTDGGVTTLDDSSCLAVQAILSGPAGGATLAMVYEGGPAQLSTAGDSTVTPPFGLFGAQPGLPHIYKIISNGKERVLHSKETGVIVHPGDRIEVLSAGGGGFGDPAERPAEQRAPQDRQKGYCSG